MSQHVALDLRLAQAFSPGVLKGNNPVFLAGNGVHGVVDVDYSATSPAAANTDFIKIYLKGVVEVKIPRDGIPSQNIPPSFARLEKKILNLVDVLPLSGSSDPTLFANHVLVKFDLALPKTTSFSANDVENFESQLTAGSDGRNLLPSSLSVEPLTFPSRANYGQRGHVKVTYTLQAFAIRRGEVVGRTLKEIRIFHTCDPQPPLYISDFAPEYLCQQKRALRRHIFAKVGSLLVAVAEPSPFVFRSEKNLALTKLRISFTVERPQKTRSKEASSLMEMCDADIIWRLKSSTFASIEPMNSTPTIKEVNRCKPSSAPPIALSTFVGIKHRLKLNIRCCNKKNLDHFAAHESHQIGVAWTSDSELVISIPKDALLVPTFFTPYASHRYSILVQIKVAGYGKSTLRLQVPVQVVYQEKPCATKVLSRDGQSNSRESYDWNCSQQVIQADVAAGLPIYVR